MIGFLWGLGAFWSLAVLAAVLAFIAVKTGMLEGTWTVKLVPPWKRQAPEPKAARSGDVDSTVPLREAS